MWERNRHPLRHRHKEPRLQFDIETEREIDGRWSAEIPEIPGALAYGKTEKQPKTKACTLAGSRRENRNSTAGSPLL